MAKSVNEVISYFENLYANKAIYLWGANSEVITQALCDKLFKTYGSATYNKTYYDNKLKEGKGRIGADCSGAMFPVSGFDTTAQNYYAKCVTKGSIFSIPRDKPCLVFKGSSTSAINHIGFYCGNGYVIEMKSSKDNCVKDLLDKGNWKWYGIPTWIDYSASKPTVNTTTVNTTTQTCIDVSSYQGNINWLQVKNSGIKYAILRGVLKAGTMDTTFETNYKNAISNGVNIIGVYHFSYALNVATSIADAKNLISKLNGKKVNIYLDLEWATQRALGKNVVTEIAKAYVNTCKSLGYTCHIYSNLDWYKNVYNANELSALGCKFWIARYPSTDTGVVKDNLKPNIGESIWQYSSKGKVSGINGDVDMNIVYDSSVLSDVTPVIIPDTNSVSSVNIEMIAKITANSLNIRTEPNATGEKVGTYLKNAIVQLIAKTSNNWYKTNKGYISGEYITSVIGQVYNCTGLNVRVSNNANSDKVALLKPNDKVYLLADNNGWYKIKLPNGIIGWSSKSYIKLI